MNPESIKGAEDYLIIIDTVMAQILANGLYPPEAIDSFSDFVFNEDPGAVPNEQAMRCANYLRKCYFQSLNHRPIGGEGYDLMEQSMMGHIFGRSPIEKDQPVPLEEALDLLGGQSDSEILAFDAVKALSTGLIKLQQRLTARHHYPATAKAKSKSPRPKK